MTIMLRMSENFDAMKMIGFNSSLMWFFASKQNRGALLLLYG